MRATHTCGRCKHREVLFVANVADATGSRDVDAWRILALGGDASVASAYVCRRCGYVELFARDAPALARSGLVMGFDSSRDRFLQHRRSGARCASCAGVSWMVAPVADWMGGWLRNHVLHAELEEVGQGGGDRLWVYLCAQCGFADMHVATLSGVRAETVLDKDCARCGGAQHRLDRLPDTDGDTVRRRRLVRLPPSGALDRATGTLRADVCTVCSHVEFWVHRPKDIPVDGLWVRLLRPAVPTGAPFR